MSTTSAINSDEQLPVPSKDELAISTQLATEIVQEIREQGAIPFSRFFNLALYHPELGYYTGPQSVFGREGDFITAPLVSSLFSQSLGNQVIEIADHLEGQYDILEVGAGDGTMARDILAYLDSQERLPNRYYILEISPNLRARQKNNIAQALPQIIDRVEWLDAPPQKEWQGVILANEVLDAFAVERFRVVDDVPFYVDVAIERHDADKTIRFVPQLRAADLALTNFYSTLLEKGFEFPNGYESEYCPDLEAWCQPLFQHLQRGVALFIDYGYEEKEYYRPERTTGTLIAHYKHRAHEDFYLYPGLQDLTANVNFSQVATILVDMGLEFLGYTSQAYFLFGNKIQELVESIKRTLGDDEIAWYEVSKRVQHLIHPEEMGERFKVLAVGKNFDHALQGFELHDYAHHL